MDYTVHGILRDRILECVAFPFLRGSSQPRDWTQVSCIAGRSFSSWATREAQEYWRGYPIPSPADLPEPVIELGCPALQANSLPTEPSGKPLSLHYCLDGMCVCEVAQSCPTLCDPMDCSLTGSSVHGIFQARVLEWVAISFSRGSSPPRNRTPVSRIAGRCFTVWATRNSGGMLYGNSASLRETRQIVLFLTTVCESTIKSVKILLD